MRKLRAALTAAAVAGAGAVAVAVGSGIAFGDTTLSNSRALPIDYASDVLVDPANRHVLVSDEQGGKLVVTDYHGSVISTRTGLPGIAELALSPDAKTLYAAVAGAHAIVAFDAATVTEQAHYSVDAKMFPRTVAAVGDQIWFGYDAGAAGDYAGNFGVLKPAKRVLRVHAPKIALHDSPRLLTRPGSLIVADTSNDASTSGHMFRFTISADGTEGAEGGGEFSDSFLRGVELTSDGTGLIGFGVDCGLWKSSAAAPHLRSQAYDQTCYPADVDVAPDGRVAIGYRNFDDTTDVALFAAGSEQPEKKFTLPSTTSDGTPDALEKVAGEPNGPRVFAVSRNRALEFRLWVVDDPDPVVPTPSPVSLTVSGNGSVSAYGATVTLTAKLGAPGREVEIRADPYGGDLTDKLVKRATTNAQGVVTAPLKLTRTTSVVVKFAGDDRYAPASVKAVLGTRIVASTVSTRQYKTAKVGTVSTAYFRKSVHPYFTTTMTAHPKRKQRLQFEVLSGGKWKPWRNVDAAVGSNGKSYYTLAGAHPVGVRYRVRPAYLPGTSGDNVNATTYGVYRYFIFTK